MKKCVIIMCNLVNEYRRDLLKQKIEFFNKRNIDVIVTSSNHIDKFDGVKNYVTVEHVVDKKYLTEGIFPTVDIHGLRFFKGYSHNKNLSHLNYFIVTHKTLYNYCKNIGYDFCFLIYLDWILKDDYFDNLIKELDTSKVYFYNFETNNVLHDMFLYGNLNSLINSFNDEKLSELENTAKTITVLTNEVALFILFKNNKDLVIKTDSVNEVFEKTNLFSINNSAEIYYDINENFYHLVCFKGDGFDNKFAVELFENDQLIYKNSFSNRGSAFYIILKNDTSYTIKYYDSDIINDYYLSKISKIYTCKHDDISFKCMNWVQKI